MTSKTYKSNFIDQFIIRIDFINPLQRIQPAMPNSLAKVIAQEFPHSVTSDIVNSEIQISPDSLRRNDISEKQWEYVNPNNPSRRVVVSSKAICYECSKYTNFKNELDKFLPIIKETLKMEDSHICRTGIRYINVLPPEKFKIKSFEQWGKYIKPYLFNLPESGNALVEALSAAFSSLEFMYPEHNAKFTYGFNSPTYPMRLNKPSLILDYDGYSNAVITTSEELETMIKTIHDQLDTLFESSITDATKGMLDNDAAK